MHFPDLKDKVAVITGGGAGIGKATAIAFARQGAKVAIVDWSEDNGLEALREIHGVVETAQAIFIQADVSKLADAKKIAYQTMQKLGRIDILHNNAAIQTYGTVVDTDEEIWDRTLAVNLKSIFLVSKFVIPHIIEAGGGAVINTASIQAHACLPNSAAYVASKGGVVALTREMALDFAKHKVRVNAVLPGSINTPMLQFAASQETEPEKAFENWSQYYPLKRIGAPEDVANLVLFLASSASGYVTGAPFMVDGGVAAQLFS
jgi:NAD(P)-dependent dehydrogenase (short-subunit alcohol dehydrogenase family)